MTDHPKSTFARRVRAAKPCDKRYDIRDDWTDASRLYQRDARVR